MKRIAAIFLVIILLMSIFGCSQNSTQQTNDLRKAPADSNPAANTENAENIENTQNTQYPSSHEESENSDLPDSSGQNSLPVSSELSNEMRVHFLDVGQADSVLVQMPDGKSMLIDAGNSVDGINIVSHIKSLGINKIDILIGTHPHADHIGGMDTVIKSLDIGKIYMPKVTHSSKTYERVLLAVKSKGLKVSSAVAGTILDAGPSVKTEILAPNSTSYDGLNNYSAVIKITYGSTAFLFTGDAEKESENEMLQKGFDLKSTVLKIGHHGSSSSTTAGFLKAVSPKYAVISTGKGNDYGHPHQEVLNRLAEANVEIYRTDESGTIVAISDGSVIKFDKAASSIKPHAPPQSSNAKFDNNTVKNSSNNTNANANINTNTNTNSKADTTQSEQKKETVYITKTGKKYHKDRCRYLSKSKIPILISQAKSEGYSACSVCYN